MFSSSLLKENASLAEWEKYLLQNNFRPYQSLQASVLLSHLLVDFVASDLDVIPFFYDSMPNHGESGIKIATKENICKLD